MNEIPNWLKNRAFLTPERLAIKTKKENLNFLELHQRVLKRANQLTYIGVKENQTVSILMGNSIEMVEVIHALKYVGAVTVLLNTRLTTRELLWQIEDCECSFVITESDFASKFNNSSNLFKTVLKEELVNLPEKALTPISTFKLDETDTIMYTSGTTGKPKGVLQSYGNHWWSAVGSALNLGLSHEDCWLAVVPFFHISGLSILMRSVIYGIPIVIQEEFDPEQANKAIIEDGVTIVSVVNVMLTKMIDHLEERSYPKTFRCMLLGGGPASKSLLESCADRAIPVFQTFGMTETSSQIVTLAPEYSLSKLGSAGKPLFPSQLRIEAKGKPVLPFEHGEIIVKGPNVTRGYYKRLDATKEAIKDDWFYTGDIGYLDEDGFLYVLDRRSDLIISGGENIYPAEIESVLVSHPSVQEAGVTGINDEKWGQVPVAFIKIKDNERLTEDDVLAYCEQKLARYKVPKAIYFIEEMPRNASNKLLRRLLLNTIHKMGDER